MTVTTPIQLTAEDVLLALTRAIVPAWGINPVDLGIVYGVEVSGPDACLTLADPDGGTTVPPDVVVAIDTTLHRRLPNLRQITIDVAQEPIWCDDFITDEGRWQLASPLPSGLFPDHTPASLTTSLNRVIDPELGINIVDLGLLRNVTVTDDHATVEMTLTTQGCPLHDSIEDAVQRVLETCHPTLGGVTVHFVWDPPWSTADISPTGRTLLANRR